MQHSLITRPLVGRLVRMLADVVMLNLCLLLALTLRFTILVGMESAPIAPEGLFRWYVISYVRNAGVLSVVCLLLFWYYGFYTHVRAYQTRHKLWIIVQAVSISFLTWGAIHYIFRGYLYLPRGAFLVAWGLTLFSMMLSRLWPHVWQAWNTSSFSQSTGHTRSDFLPVLVSEQPKHILLIGGAGYIGSALLEELLSRGYRVRILDLLIYGTEPIEPFLQHPSLDIIQADFRQVDQVLRAMQGVDTVVHLGAIVGDPACAYDETLTLEINVLATTMIADIAKRCGVSRFVFASTCSVYGAGTVLLDEHSQLNPMSLYARSKIASEQALQSLADEKFSPTLLRFGTLYGFSGRIRFDLVVNILTARAILDGTMTVLGGEQWRPLLHVRDAAHAILQVLEAPRNLVHNEIFNVGSSGQNYTIAQIAQTIQEIVPQAQILYQDENTDRRNYRVSFDKIEQILHFQPRWTLLQGIEQIANAIHSGQIKDYHDPRYSNVKFLQEEGSARLTRYFHHSSESITDSTPIVSLSSSKPPYQV